MSYNCSRLGDGQLFWSAKTPPPVVEETLLKMAAFDNSTCFTGSPVNLPKDGSGEHLA